MLSTSPTPITGGAALAALPAFAQFDFPVAMIASELTVDGRVRTLVEAGQIDEVFPFASVTKPIVAWSALVAVERGLLDLDAPAGAGTAHGAAGAGTAHSAAGAMLPGATVRHLLAHASGIAFDSDAVLAAPGTRRIYSNRGIEILGERLQEATATPLERWVETTVLEPLGMSSVLVPGSPAHSGEGTARDLAVFAGELAAPRLISASLAAEATSVVFPGLDGVLPGYGRQAPNDFGLGVEVRGHKHPHWTGRAGSPATFGHFGQSGSFIWVDPEARRQAVFLGERRFAAVHKDIWPDLCDQILALEAPDSAVNG
ncbi:serine hydrolase domain-containing protein [Actinomyces massiliensis]|uniref:Beta-lactamase n=1 Tax=Actinomyces massiliensis F0489 TaxID=1125718 RepID=J0XFB0_9ACTO|nr:serine hydrolase domain-containing protein [Actinomyces massiliensis]EJF47416.1 beta-lactamase [Actinomyces massiliensis F0489]WLD72005.1 serine hydrolase domain-containing protein [Actinomyces massiliensis]